MGPGAAGLVLTDRQAQDVDEGDDWLLAELKHRLIREPMNTSGGERVAP